MAPLFILLLFLALTSAEDNVGASEAIAKANKGPRVRLHYGDIRPNADRCTARQCLWHKIGRYVEVPFLISPKYSEEDRNTIIEALKTFSSSTCIRFTHRSAQRDFIIFYPDDGCWSSLGRQGGPQYISLDPWGCLSTSTIQHEALHALGFHHEQSHSDRDQYIEILFNNIEREYADNFEKVDTNNLETPYDFNSIMQYDSYAFSFNGRRTIVSKTNPEMELGTADSMTALDIARVKRLYKCSPLGIAERARALVEQVNLEAQSSGLQCHPPLCAG